MSRLISFCNFCYSVAHYRLLLFSDDPSADEMKKILTLPKANVRSKSNVKVGEMMEETRQILHEFYKPFNEELAQMAGDEKFNYGIR